MGTPAILTVPAVLAAIKAITGAAQVKGKSTTPQGDPRLTLDGYHLLPDGNYYFFNERDQHTVVPGARVKAITG